ncbi:hypothetical protein ACXR2W_00980 [Leucobacter sp. HY1908]
MSARYAVAVFLLVLIGAAAVAVYLVRVLLGLTVAMDGAAFLALLSFNAAAVLYAWREVRS